MSGLHFTFHPMKVIIAWLLTLHFRSGTGFTQGDISGIRFLVNANCTNFKTVSNLFFSVSVSLAVSGLFCSSFFRIWATTEVIFILRAKFLMTEFASTFRFCYVGPFVEQYNFYKV